MSVQFGISLGQFSTKTRIKNTETVLFGKKWDSLSPPNLAKREGSVATENVGGYPRPKLDVILCSILVKFGNGDKLNMKKRTLGPRFCVRSR